VLYESGDFVATHKVDIMSLAVDRKTPLEDHLTRRAYASAILAHGFEAKLVVRARRSAVRVVAAGSHGS
jgi:hypothetical protein